MSLITLDEFLANKKSRFVNLDSKNFNLNVEVKKVKDLHDESLIEKIYSWGLDILIEIGWSQKIPVSILNIQRPAPLDTQLFASSLPGWSFS